MTKARRRSFWTAALVAAAVPWLACAAQAEPGSGAAGSAAASPAPAAGGWEAALQRCAPGGAFDACVAGLTAAKLTLRNEDNGDHREVSFDLQPPIGGVAIRTYKKAAGKIVSVNVVLLEDKGKGRKDLLAWFKQQIGKTAKQGRSGGSAEGCGADGWGVGWVAGKSTQPEVELQLGSPESSSPEDQPDKLKPEDALLKRAGDGTLDLCFLLPAKGPGYVDAPEISPSVLAAFLASPLFHGKAKLK